MTVGHGWFQSTTFWWSDRQHWQTKVTGSGLALLAVFRRSFLSFAFSPESCDTENTQTIKQCIFKKTESSLSNTSTNITPWRNALFTRVSILFFGLRAAWNLESLRGSLEKTWMDFSPL